MPEVALRFTPPTDGEYSFITSNNSVVSVRESCGAAPLVCDGSGSRAKLKGGVPVVVGLSNNTSWAYVQIERAQAEFDCKDSFDGDGDGDGDCDDSDCTWQCQVAEVCDNGIDDDDDGDVDCADNGCDGAECSANLCPGEELGSVTGEGIAGGNALLAPEETLLSCNSLQFPSSRYFTWTAPSAGDYHFGVQSEKWLYHMGIRVLDGGCDADVLACKTALNSGSAWLTGVTVPLAAGQEVVLEVGSTPSAVGPTSTNWKLAITAL